MVPCSFTGELTHTVVPYAQTVVLCVVMGGGGTPLIQMGPLFNSSSFLRGIDPHSGSVYPHSGCLCYDEVEGETPDNHGTLKVVFKYSATCHRGIDTHSGSVCPQTG